MFDLNGIVSQVLENCNISDSQHAGVYSICGLALRLRDLYKWEKGLEPWVEDDSVEILECSVQRKLAQEVRNIVLEIEPDAFITSRDIQRVWRGYWHD